MTNNCYDGQNKYLYKNISELQSLPKLIVSKTLVVSKNMCQSILKAKLHSCYFEITLSYFFLRVKYYISNFVHKLTKGFKIIQNE